MYNIGWVFRPYRWMRTILWAKSFCGITYRCRASFDLYSAPGGNLLTNVRPDQGPTHDAGFFHSEYFKRAGPLSLSGGLWELSGRAGAVLNCSLSAVDPSRYYWISHVVRHATCLASAPHHGVVLDFVYDWGAFGCGLLAVSCVVFTSYVSCPVRRAPPAVTKVDGEPRVLSMRPGRCCGHNV